MPGLPRVTPASPNSYAIISDGLGPSILILERDTQDKTDREATNRICGPSLGLGSRVLAQPLCLDFSALARGKGGKEDGGGIRGRVLALLSLGGGGGGAAGPAIKRLAEKAGEKEEAAAEEAATSRAGNIVYRGGPDTPRNLTPRHPADTVDTDQPGLSTYRTPEQAMGETSKKAQMIDLTVDQPEVGGGRSWACVHPPQDR
jgi:hypothetical protein